MLDVATDFCTNCCDKYAESRMYNDPQRVAYYWCDTGETSPSIGRTRCGSCGAEEFGGMARVVGMYDPLPDRAHALDLDD